MRSAPPWRMVLAGPATLVGVGFLLGFRHAFEPDHLAAVSTLATRQGTVRDAMRLGAAWGVGHTATVGVVALILIAADLRLPSAFQPVAELVVAALLVSLGVTVLARHAARHRHAFGPAHEDAHRHHAAHAHVPPIRDARRSLAFGIAHGLAGSGAIVVLMVAAAATRREQLAYFAAFGTGTILGMLGVSAGVAALARAAAQRGRRWATWLHLGTAAASIAIGALLAAETTGAF